MCGNIMNIVSFHCSNYAIQPKENVCVMYKINVIDHYRMFVVTYSAPFPNEYLKKIQLKSHLYDI